MFEVLSDKFASVFRNLGNKGRLTEKDVDQALREVRLALLEADVNFKVVKDFIGGIRERALNAEVLDSLTPAQQVLKVVNEQLIAVLGGAQSYLATSSRPPTVVMLVGLQGSGKTTTAAKLAQHVKGTGQRPLLVAADHRRPAAIEQLVALGEKLDIPVYHEATSEKPADVCSRALKRARQLAATWVIADTGGRLHIDEPMMEEAADIKKALDPHEVLLVVDAMTGQDAVRAATEFNERLGLTGLILTKLDGDARGGAALSIKSVSGVPIKFIGTGEKTDAIEPFFPDRLASRVLGMGDMLTFIEKAQQTMEVEEAARLEKKVRHASLDLEDFLGQLRQMQKMGPLDQLMDMVPGLSSVARRASVELDDSRLKKVEAIILSMTPEERRRPEIIDGSRKRRIARGSGTTPQDVNQLLNQFRQAQKLMKQVSRGKMPPSVFR